MSTTIKARVLSKLGQNNANYLDDISNIANLWSDTIWNTLTTSMPSRIMIGEINPGVDPTNLASGSNVVGDNEIVDGKYILLVIRTAANHVMDGNTIVTEQYIQKAANQVSLENSYKSLDPDSIYFATNNSPVYWLEKKTVTNVAATRIRTAPATTAHTHASSTAPLENGKAGLEIYAIKRFEFPTAAPDGNDSSDEPVTWDTCYNIPLEYTEDDSANTIEFNSVLPEDGENLIITKLALAVALQKLANASIQDEDTEVTALLQNQIKVFSEEVALETQRLEGLWSE
jgi:hypothetical protein